MTDEAKALANAIRKEVCNCHICGLCGWKPKRAADLIEAQAREIDRLREELAEAYIKLSGKSIHTSDCATSNAPAMDPGPCNCDAPEDSHD